MLDEQLCMGGGGPFGAVARLELPEIDRLGSQDAYVVDTAAYGARSEER